MNIVAILPQPQTAGYQRVNWLMRSLAWSVAVFTLVYLFNNFLNVWHDWPGVVGYFFAEGGADSGRGLLAWLQLLSYLIIPFAALAYSRNTPQRLMIHDSDRLSAWSAYIIRVAFWSVVLIGLIDGLVSWLRIENLLPMLVGDDMAVSLGKSNYRGTFVHFPLIGVSLFLAYFFKNISVSWLALLVVFAEAWIVIARFVFSYEQTLMGDLVRFWYAALLLFSAAYTLREEGHVRVDVLYAAKSPRYKAWVNTVGILLLAFPFCGMILGLGLWDKNAVLNGPMANFEISQASYGLFIKYLMAGFLVIFALSMVLQFCSYLLKNVAVLSGEVEAGDDPHDDIAA